MDTLQITSQCIFTDAVRQISLRILKKSRKLFVVLAALAVVFSISQSTFAASENADEQLNKYNNDYQKLASAFEHAFNGMNDPLTHYLRESLYYIEDVSANLSSVTDLKVLSQLYKNVTQIRADADSVVGGTPAQMRLATKVSTAAAILLGKIKKLWVKLGGNIRDLERGIKKSIQPSPFIAEHMR